MTQAEAMAHVEGGKLVEAAEPVGAGKPVPRPALDYGFKAAGPARCVHPLFDENAGDHDRINRLFSLNIGGRGPGACLTRHGGDVAGFLAALERRTAR